jgi:hypothetical protein
MAGGLGSSNTHSPVPMIRVMATPLITLDVRITAISRECESPSNDALNKRHVHLKKASGLTFDHVISASARLSIEAM